MTRIALSGGAYQARSPAASCQRQLNLYSEAAPPGEDSPPQTLYRVPGTKYVTQPAGGSNPAPVRGLYTPGSGVYGIAYAVIGAGVYQFNALTSGLALIGSINAGTTPVWMQDNGIVIMIVDGTGSGWYITIATGILSQISDPAFFGGTSVVVLDTYFLLNRPGTQTFYASPSNYVGNSTPFDPLYLAEKVTYPDNIQGLACVNQIVWVLGIQSTELWYDAGATDFPFQRVPEVLLGHGCVSAASIATMDAGVFWLSNDLQGRNIVMHGSGYQASAVSTPAIDYQISTYADTTDAIGFCYQQQGHWFYVLTFPSANKTWVYDISTQLWHERCSIDGSGNEFRILANCVTNAATKIYVGHISNGSIYELNPTVGTDNMLPIKCQRTFEHLLNDGKRLIIRSFMADFETVGSAVGNVSLDWSDDRGETFGTALQLPFNDTTIGSLTWWRLGQARDRVFRLTWTADVEAALQGAWVQADPQAS
jgi:hypothetical protein